jgi:hypothetical protein
MDLVARRGLWQLWLGRSLVVDARLPWNDWRAKFRHPVRCTACSREYC